MNPQPRDEPTPFCAAAGLALTLVLAAPAARAAGSLEIAGAPTARHGLTARLFARGAEAAFYNPALLPGADPGISLGFFVLTTHESVTRSARPPGADVSSRIYGARSGSGGDRLQLRPLPTVELPGARLDTDETTAVPMVTLGLVRPIVGERLVAGFFASLPTSSFQRQEAFFPDERQQYFGGRLRYEMLGDRLTQSTFAIGLGGRVAPWLALGMGIDLTIGTLVRTAVHVPDVADQRAVLVNPDIEVESAFSPHLAIETRPARSFALVTTLHFATFSETVGENALRFWNYTYPEGDNAVRQRYRLALAYEPLRFGLGARYESEPAPHEVTSSKGVELGVTAVLQRWSTYLDRHGERPADAFQDTIALAAAAGVGLGRTRISADLGFAPSPVPAQSGRTNYVDGTRLSAQLGAEHAIAALGDVVAGAYLSGSVMLARRETKSAAARHPVLDEFPDGATDVVTSEVIPESFGLQTNNPGYPGYESSAWMLGAGASLRFR